MDQFEGHSLLIIEDNPINLRVLEGHLSDYGFRLLIARTGETGLQRAQQFQPDIILLDVMLPDIDGFTVCQKMRRIKETKAIPIIFITALSDVSDKVKGFQAGAVDYITKPVHREELLARITTHLTLRDLQNELKQTNVVLRQANLQLEQQVGQRTAELERVNRDLNVEIDKRRTAYEGLRKLNEAYSRFVPKEFLRLLNRGQIMGIELGHHHEMEMTIMFSDIRSFTTLSEKMSTQENFNFVNAFFRRVSPTIRENNGFVDKYIGDAIMALFPTNPDDALRAAVFMQEILLDYNKTRNRPGRLPINIGIGLHTGRVMLGTVGEPERMEATVISDAVNLAARLEGLTKLYGAALVISQSTLEGLQRDNLYEYRFLDRVKVKGKESSVAVFEVLNGNPPEITARRVKTRHDFEAGLEYYQQQEFKKALSCFEKVISADAEDKAAHLYARRAKQRLIHPDWDETEISLT